MKSQKQNRLIGEKSPYLLQHADNPVDWYPWGAEAFKAARQQDKPIFLSIGYATCHWCHVMAHESFEDSTVAALMNEAFINIKVDREERPDIDAIYMTVCQMLNGNGGWPLTIVMTPEKAPFFAATYLPRESRFQRMGMVDLIPRIQHVWTHEREKALASAAHISQSLAQASENESGNMLKPAAMDQAFKQLKERFDPKYGGFGNKPKFPTAHNLMFLLRYYQRNKDPQVLAMVEKTLQEMRKGGMYDHVGFGFHRYSTDEKWCVPHFEKMLYDQAILSIAYTEAYQITGNEQYRRTAEEILSYVLRDMTDPEGGFYSAEDADSEGEEGLFYLWKNHEIIDLLGKTDGDWVAGMFHLKNEGNFLEEASRQLTGRNIFYLEKDVKTLASEEGISEAALLDKWEVLRQQLFKEREKRIHPLKDDKILTDWNGLMIVALCKAAQAFDAPEYADAARKAADFILQKMYHASGALFHRYREGAVAIPAYLDDYAFLNWGLIELYETVFDIKYLETALSINEYTLAHFWDKDAYGFFFTADNAEKLLIRKKEIYDGAIPSGNAVMMLNLLRLGRMTGHSALEARASKIGQAFSGTITRYPAGYTLFMLALDFGVGPTKEVVVVGDPAAEDTQKMLKSIQKAFIPDKVLLLRPLEQNAKITDLADFTKLMTASDNRPTVYICRNYTCEQPTTDMDEMLKRLLQ